MDNKKDLEKKERNHKIINSQRCAGYLMYHGCHIIRTEPSNKNQYYNIFVFYDDEKTAYWLTKFTEEEESKGNARRKEVHSRQDRKSISGLA
ncbi:MAG: hypothetical protein IKO36_02570 [Bacteroidaceae bacterium]|nr:hypothetical protein [Bacteroidaceae bacterium]